MALLWADPTVVFCLVWMPWFSISVLSTETEAWSGVILRFNLGKTEIISWRKKFEEVVEMSVHLWLSVCLPWIIHNGFQIDIKKVMLIALYHLHLPKRLCMSFWMEMFTVTCKHKIGLSQCMWLLFETQTPGENKSLLTRGNILLGVPGLAIYLESGILASVISEAWSSLMGCLLPRKVLEELELPWICPRAQLPEGWLAGRVSSSLNLPSSLRHSHGQLQM